MNISASIVDWDYFSARSRDFWLDIDESKSKGSIFTLLNDSVIMNCDFGELYLAHRAHLPSGILPQLDQFLVNCVPQVSAPLGISPDRELPTKVEEVWAALSPETVRTRLAAITGDNECLLYDALEALAEHVQAPAERIDPVIETGQDVLGFLQTWICVHAEALAMSRGILVVIG